MAMHVDQCQWDQPGSDRYTGTPSAAIARMPGIPVAVRTRLIERVDRHDFDDAVMIDRDSIRSPKHAYAPELRFMAFGSHGKLCERVTRGAWSPDRVEGAWVYCDSGWCVAMPAVCRNWSIVTRLEDDPAPEASTTVLAWAPPEGPAAPPALAEPSPSLPVDEPSFAHASSARWLPFGTPGAAGIPPAWLAPGPLSPIPAVAEPSTLVLVALGLAGLIAWRRTDA